MHSIEEESRDHRGHQITIKWYQDDSMGAPWEEHDGHGIVSEWTRRDKYPHERVLCSDRYSKRYYDVAATMERAKAEGWGVEDREGKTRKQIIAEAVDSDFRYLKRWCEDDWRWVGYTVEIEGFDYDDPGQSSLWGIESDSMREFEKEAFQYAIDWLDNELSERENAACRDIATV